MCIRDRSDPALGSKGKSGAREQCTPELGSIRKGDSEFRIEGAGLGSDTTTLEACDPGSDLRADTERRN
eukprot:13894850-Alexandrium_andersonii.AAC.1